MPRRGLRGEAPQARPGRRRATEGQGTGGRAQGHLEIRQGPRAQPAARPPARRRGAGRGAAAPRRPAAAARPSDRAPAPDPGRARLPLGRAPARPRRGDAARPGRGLGGRDLLRPFRSGPRRRPRAAAPDGPRLRRPLLRARRRRGADRGARHLDPAAVRVVRAPCMGRCDTAPTAEIGHFHADRATAASVADGGRRRPRPPGHSRLPALRRLHRGRGLPHTFGAARRHPHPRRSAGGAHRLGAARPRRRRLPLGAQVERGSQLPRAPLRRGQRRRRRARHLQGPLLSRAHPAPDARGPLDRRLGRRGRARLSLHARRIPRGPRDPAPRDRRARSRRDRRARLHRAPPRRRRLHLRRGIGDARIDRGQARPAAPPAALRRRGRPLRPPDAGPQRRDPALDRPRRARRPGDPQRARR